MVFSMPEHPDRQRMVEAAYAVLAAVDVRDRRDTEFHLSGATAEVLSGEWPHDARKIEGGTLFGLPMRRDESIPYGEIRAVTENEQERAIRRLLAEGKPVNVIKMQDSWFGGL